MSDTPSGVREWVARRRLLLLLLCVWVLAGVLALAYLTVRHTGSRTQQAAEPPATVVSSEPPPAVASPTPATPTVPASVSIPQVTTGLPEGGPIAGGVVEGAPLEHSWYATQSTGLSPVYVNEKVSNNNASWKITGTFPGNDWPESARIMFYVKEYQNGNWVDMPALASTSEIKLNDGDQFEYSVTIPADIVEVTATHQIRICVFTTSNNCYPSPNLLANRPG